VLDADASDVELRFELGGHLFTTLHVSTTDPASKSADATCGSGYSL